VIEEARGGKKQRVCRSVGTIGFGLLKTAGMTDLGDATAGAGASNEGLDSSKLGSGVISLRGTLSMSEVDGGKRWHGEHSICDHIIMHNNERGEGRCRAAYHGLI
jgi:hypothetical protein